MGRFITPDTIVPDYNNPQAFNRYSYAGNNPVSHLEDGHGWFKKFWKSVVSAVAGIAAFVGSGFNPVIGFQVFSMVNSGLNLGQALVTGQGIGQAFGTFAASFALSAGFGGIGWHDIVNPVMRMGAFAIEGATIGVAGAAINNGDFGQGAYTGAGLGATMGFLSSEQFQNWRGKNGFVTDKQLAARNAVRAHRVESWLADNRENYEFRIGVSKGHAGTALIEPDGVGVAKGFWPKEGMGQTRALLGETALGDVRNEAAFWSGAEGGFDTYHSYGVNGTQAVMIKQYMSATPQGNWALTTNCTDWAVEAALSGGIYMPRTSYSHFGFADPAVLRNYYREN